MEDNTELNPADTEVTADREEAELSIRQSLKQNFKNTKPEVEAKTSTDDEDTGSDDVAVEPSPAPQQAPPPMAPPADMNTAE